MLSLSEDTDPTLFAAIAARGASARPQMEELYRRHVRYLYGVVRKQCLTLCFSDAETEDVVHDTFQRAFDHAQSFRPCESGEPDAERRWTRAWLGRIARNLILDQLGADRERLVGDELERFAEAPPPSSRRPNARLAALREALATLSEREQDVLTVFALYHRGGHTQRLPNEVSLELARRWETTNDNIRAIRMRALRKLTTLTEQLLTHSSEPNSIERGRAK